MTAKRLFDLLLSLVALLLCLPLLLVLMPLIWLGDGRSPLFFGERVGRGNRDFRMVKLRSMTVGAVDGGATSVARRDARVTPIGRMLRRSKLDELPQFWNVLCGEMSLVGPRPNTRRGGVDDYTPEERRLLAVRPGLTDLASIVFSDEGEILDGAVDPDALYDAVIRPWKSRLGLLYVDHRSLATDGAILLLTAIALVAKPLALLGVDALLARWHAGEDLRRICRRAAPPFAAPPPGAVA